MKNFSEKLTMALDVFSPIIILVLVFCAYLYQPTAQEADKINESSKKQETVAPRVSQAASTQWQMPPFSTRIS